MKDSRQPIRSMTGYARVRKQVAGGELVVSVKSVNHRGLDVRFHLTPDLEPFENAMRARIVKRIRRGHADVRVSFNRTAGTGGIGLNRPMLEAYLGALRQAREEFGLAGEPDLGTILRTPGMLTEASDSEPAPEFEPALMAVLEETLDGLNAFREREGAQLAAEISARVQKIRQAAMRMEEIRSRVLPLFQARLQQRLGELLEAAPVEPQRLAQEAAMLADRSDIGEELARLKIHAGQLDAILATGGEVGKRLDFLLQEMHREANTILSKTNGTGEAGLDITELGLAAKSEIEKIREQALNLE